MTLLKLDLNLTARDPNHARTHSGMAHFAGTGPDGMTCRHCEHWRHEDWAAEKGKMAGAPKPAQCSEYRRLTGGAAAPPVPHYAAACKYFAPRAEPIPMRRPARS